MLQPVIDRLKRFLYQKTTARNISKVYIGNILSSAITFVTTLILIRGLDIADYAYYIIFVSVATFASGIVGSGFNVALVRFSADYYFRTNKRPYALYGLALFVQTATFLILMAIGLLLSNLFSLLLLGDPNLARPFRFGMMYGLGLLLLELGRSFYQAEERFNFYIGVLGLGRLILLGLLIGVSIMHLLTFEVVAWLTASIQVLVGLGAIFQNLLSRNLSSIRSEIEQGGDSIHHFLSATGWLIAYFITLAAFSRMDIFLLSRLSSQEQVAMYGVAFQYYSMVLLLLASIHAVLLPLFSRPYMQDSTKQRNFLRRWLRYTSWTIFPLILFGICGKPIFVWVSGNRYQHSFDILMILLIGVWLSLMFSPLVNILISREDFRFLFVLGFAALVFNVASNYLVIPLLNGLGAAIITVLTHNVVLQFPILWRALQCRSLQSRVEL